MEKGSERGPVKISELGASASTAERPGLGRPSFVGRAAEIGLLEQWLSESEGGRGRVVMVAGEPGIGKTCLVGELAERARRRGGIVLGGACWEGEADRPYGPFAEALDGYAAGDAASALREVGPYAGVLARLAPCLRTRLPGSDEPVALQPSEERARLFDAVNQWLLTLTRRAPVTLVLDDLHWADDDSIALLRHVARSVGQQRLLVVSAYRSGEVEEAGALAEALAVLRRQTSFERLGLKGFGLDEVGALLQGLAAQRRPGSLAAAVDPALVQAILTKTNGNPFFVRSVVLHLLEERTLRVDGGSWRATAPIADIGLPDGVRQLLNKRLGRLSPEARSFLTVGAAIGATFRFDVATAVAELSEERGLEVVDETLVAQLIAGTAVPDTYAFVHALVRQALYEALNPSRQVRLHRRIAETMEGLCAVHVAEIAEHYHRSRVLAGAERGFPFAVAAAERTSAASAHRESAALLRKALDLLPAADARRGRTCVRLAAALILTPDSAEAVEAALRGAQLVADVEGADAAADCLAETAQVMFQAGLPRQAHAVATRGMHYLRTERRDMTWVRLIAADIARREAQNADHPGLLVDSNERREVRRIAWGLNFPERERLFLGMNGFRNPTSRSEALALFGDEPDWLMHGGGELRGAAHLFGLRAAESKRVGRIADAVTCWANRARCLNALGEFERASTVRERARGSMQRLEAGSVPVASLAMVDYDLLLARGEGWEHALGGLEAFVRDPDPEHWWIVAAFRSLAAVIAAQLGRIPSALQLLSQILPALEQAPGWARGYPVMACNAASALWATRTTDHLDVVERGLREKVLDPDLRYPMQDARLSLARLCALRGDSGEAIDWFNQARLVLDEQGARPLRAIVDYDEALMCARRGADGDRERAEPLLRAALAQFHSIDMPGWIRQAEHLLTTGEEWPAGENTAPSTTRPPPGSLLGTAGKVVGAEARRPTSTRALFRAQGEFWTIEYAGVTVQLKHGRGLLFLAQLLREPNREIRATDLVASAGSNATTPSSPPPASARASLGDAGEMLDAQARAAYKRRLDELREDLDEAERFNDTGRSERLREELEVLTRELSRAVGIGGRARVAGSHAERARVNVTRAISAALKKIAAQHPALGEHFAHTIRTGTFCSYGPDPRAPVEWEV